jgi:hypothetical protein
MVTRCQPKVTKKRRKVAVTRRVGSKRAFPNTSWKSSSLFLYHLLSQTTAQSHLSNSLDKTDRLSSLLLPHLTPLHTNHTSPVRNASAHASWRPQTHSYTVLEARLEQANLLKKVVEAIKDLVQDCNFECNDSGVGLQAMDNSHVALVSMLLKADSFSPFRCDRNIALGINLVSLQKVLRAAQDKDVLTLKAEDSPDVVNLVFESSESDRISEYDIKLMDIDQEHLGIPDTDYAASITLPSAELQRICRDLSALSESGEFSKFSQLH